MIRPFQIISTILAATLICSAAGAQMRGGAMSARMPAVRLAPMARTSISMRAPRSLRLGSSIRILPNGQFAPAFSTFANRARFASVNAVPGLGFDYTHLAAIRGGIPNNGYGNFRRGSRRGQAPYAAVLIGGYPYYYYGDYYGDSTDYGQPQQQQVVEVPQPAPAAVEQQDAGTEVPAAISSAPATPVRDVGDFILVQRDGRVLFASAFSIVGDQLRYVTPEGIRHSVPMAEMDPDATQQMNEARGTTVQLHN